MKKKPDLLKILGYLLPSTGIILLIAWPEIRPGMIGVICYFSIVLGPFLILYADSRTSVRRKTAFELSVRRRALLFSLMTVLYIIIAGLIMIRADQAGADIRSLTIQIGIGFFAVVAAYLLLIHQMIQERRSSRIQDSAIGEMPVFANERLFTMVIEHSETNSALRLKGVLHGSVQANDEAWVIEQGKIRKTTIQAVEADGEKTVLSISGNENPRGKYAIITSIIPYRYIDSETPVANPELFALIQGANDHPMTRDYLGHLVYIAAHCRYLVRVRELPTKETWFSRFSSWLFSSQGYYVPETVSRKDGDNPACACYSDWNAFQKVLQTVSEPERRISRAMIFTFQQIAETALKTNGEIIINPFGPVSFCISTELLKEVTESEAYKKEFSGSTENR